MTCEQIREQLVETARGRELSSDLRAIVFSHAAACMECARRLENERRLSTALSELSLATESAPARMAQLIARQLPVVPIITPMMTGMMRTKRPGANRVWVAGAIAAAVAAIGFFGWRLTVRPAPVVSASAQSSVASPGQSSAQLIPAAAGAPLRRLIRPKRRSTKAVAASESGDFVRLPFTDDLRPEEATEIVRVQLSPESLASMGVPVTGELDGGEIKADVLVGMDGTARAIRLLD